MKRRTLRIVLLISIFLLVAGFGLAVFSQDLSQPQTYSPLDLAAYLSSNDVVWIRPGLNVSILNVAIGSDRKPVVTYQIADGSNQPLDRDGNLTPGKVATNFILAYIPQSATQYVSYGTRTATNTTTGATTQQAATDSGGTYASLGNGTYTYTFKTVLPSNYDATATHTLGIYATRDLTTFGLSLYVSNVVKSFVPNGAPVTKVRDIVPTTSCNQCHDPLAAHGSTGRQAMEICILCHTPQTIDPNTGQTADMKVMVHKIHMGSSLPSVKAGKPYQFMGHGLSDFSTVVFPQDIRNCTTCHKNTMVPNQNTAQVYNFLLNPTRDACGACHDDINWTTGANHPAGPETNDSQCSTCHIADGQSEYDAAVKDAHIPEYKSSQLINPQLKVLSVTNTKPGQNPTITFQITDKNSNVLDPNKVNRLSMTLAGPTSDYRWMVTENPLGKVVVANGVGTYTFKNAIPSTATGTYVVESEAYVNTTVQKLAKPAVTVRDAIDNVVTPFAVTGTLTPRRAAVTTANCDVCHDKLLLHGSNRNQIEACVVCHNPTMTDSSMRPAAANPPETIDLPVLIHKIHTGENLTTDYTIYGYGGSKNNFNDIRFMGDTRDCLKCHVSGAYAVPVPGTATPVTTPRGYWTPMMPTAADCLTCHDSISSAAHALLNTATIGGNQVESCPVCHQEGADNAVSQMHAR